MSLASDILLAPLAKYFSTSEEKVFHVIKCLLAFLFLLLCDRILKAHEKSELEKRRKEKKEEEFPKPQPKGDLTRKELKEFDGKDAKKPILLACKGTIFDVSSGRDFYGPGNIYFFFCVFNKLTLSCFVSRWSVQLFLRPRRVDGVCESEHFGRTLARELLEFVRDGSGRAERLVPEV